MEQFIKIELEKADREHFIKDDRVVYGEIFYLKSQESGHFFGPYLLRNDQERLTNFKTWLQADMVWIQKTRI